jgi:hypothetical protein
LLNTVFSTAGLVDTWVQYGSDVGTGFRLDEFLGHSGLTDNGGASRFCVNYRIAPVENLGAGVDNSEYSVWLVRVRVSWTNDRAFPTTWQLCDPTNVETRIVTDATDEAVELTAMAPRELAR